MKSTLAQLENRGYLTDEKFEKYRDNCGIDTLLVSSIPVERTAGVRLISLAPERGYLEILCGMLIEERKLYTKIEISECLVKYGKEAVPHLLNLLGKAGNNHHKAAVNVDLKKKSYPLPRDIAARTLVKIGPAVLNYVTAPGFNIQGVDLSELIDVIGHISFNYRDFSCKKMILDLYREYQYDELLCWKIIRAFQAFRSDEVKGLLERIISENKSEILVKEAGRSLERIAGRNA